jgi:phosphate transport system substrate-binding protein
MKIGSFVISSLTSLALPLAALAADGHIVGGGASGASTAMALWSKGFAAKKGGSVEYTPSSSLKGLAALKKGDVEFGLSEARVSVPDLLAADLVQFPVLIEGDVVVVNLPKMTPGALKLTGPIVADIYMGRIKTWDDPAIHALNPGTALPSLPIHPLYREPESGTSFLFTSYLSTVSGEWKDRAGAGSSVKWPAGQQTAKPGGDGMAEQVTSTEGAIGYVDFARATRKKLVWTQLQNKAGKWVSPTPDGFAAAAASVDWQQAPSFAVIIVDEPGEGTWPISGACFAIVHRVQVDAPLGRLMLQFFEYGLTEGGAAAREAGYVPVPESVVKVVRDAWPRLVKTADGTSLLK